MTPEQITGNKATFIALCHEHIHREGLDKLLDYLETTDFYTAPSSTNYHLNEMGGLCQHSINVFRTACKVYETVIAPALEQEDTPFSEPISMESIAIATLLHDLCKTKLYHQKEKWKKDEAGRWMSYPGYEVKDDFPFGHGEKSCLILNWFIRLKQEELLAIRWHMGMFDITEASSPSRYAFYAAMEKSPLVTLLQVADLLSSNCLEQTTKY